MEVVSWLIGSTSSPLSLALLVGSGTNDSVRIASFEEVSFKSLTIRQEDLHSTLPSQEGTTKCLRIALVTPFSEFLSQLRVRKNS